MRLLFSLIPLALPITPGGLPDRCDSLDQQQAAYCTKLLLSINSTESIPFGCPENCNTTLQT